MRWRRWLIGIVILLLTLPLILVLLLMHPHSPRWISEFVSEQVEFVAIEGVQGHWFDNLAIDSVAIDLPDDGGKIHLQQIELQLVPQCLFAYRVCAERLHVEQLDIDIAPSEDRTPVDDEPFVYRFPVPLHVKQLTLAEFNLKLDGFALQSRQLAADVKYGPLGLAILSGDLKRLSMQIAESEPSIQPPDSVPSVLTLPAVYAPFPMEIYQLALTQLDMTINDQLQRIERIQLSAEWQNYQLKFEQLDATWGPVEAQLQGNLALEAEYPLALTGKWKWLDPNLPGAGWTLAAEGDLAELALKIRSAKPLDVRLKGHVKLLQPAMGFHLSASLGRWLVSEPDIVLSQTSLNLVGDLDSYQADLSSSISGGALPDTRIEAGLVGDLAHLDMPQLKLSLLDGVIEGKAKLQWQDQVSASWQLQGMELNPAGWQEALPEQLRFSSEGRLQWQDEEHWQFDLEQLQADALLNERQWKLNAVSDANVERVRIKKLVLTDGKGKLNVSGTVGQQWQIDGVIALNQSPSPAFVWQSLHGDFSIRGKRLSPDVRTQLIVDELEWQQLSLPKSSLNGLLRWRDKPQFDLKLNVQQPRNGQQQWDHWKLALNGNTDEHQLDLSVKANFLETQLSVQGRHSDKQLWQGTLQRWALNYLDNQRVHQWQLAQPVRIKVDDADDWQMQDTFCMALDPASFCIETLAMNAGHLTFDSAAKQFELGLFEPLFDEEAKLEGQLNGVLSLAWNEQAHLVGQGQLSLSPGSLLLPLEDRVITQRWQGAELDADFEPSRWLLNAELMLNRDSKLATEMVLTDPYQAKKLAGSIHINQLLLSELEPWVGSDLTMAGVIGSDLQLAGSLYEPSVSGQVLLSDLSLQHALGLQIDDGQVQLDFSGYEGQLSGWFGQGEQRLNLKGHGEWRGLAPKFAMELDSPLWPILLPELGNINIEPHVQFDYDDHKVHARGNIRVIDGNLAVENLPGSAVTVSDDEIIIDTSADKKRQQSRPIQIDSEIKVELGEKLELFAFGLDGRLTGDLLLRQLNNDLSLFGSVQVRDGRFQSFGQALILRRAVLSFNGPPSLPVIDAEAIRDPDKTEDNVVAGLRIQGAATRPEIKVFSEPRGMAQQRVLSYLVRGRDLETGSADDDGAMTMAMIGLGLTGTGQMVGAIGESLGVRDLSLDTKGAGNEAQVVVSANLLPGLNVRYGRGIFQPISELTLRYHLIKNLYVEAVSGINNAADLVYRVDF